MKSTRLNNLFIIHNLGIQMMKIEENKYLEKTQVLNY